MFLSKIRPCCRWPCDKRAPGQSVREAFMPNSQIPWPLRVAVIVVFLLGVFVGLTAAPGASFGLTVNSLTSANLRDLGLPTDTQGVLVSAVRAGSLAAQAGLRAGDII